MIGDISVQNDHSLNPQRRRGSESEGGERRHWETTKLMHVPIGVWRPARLIVPDES